MKKFKLLSILLAFTFIFTACGKQGQDENATNETSTTQEAQNNETATGEGELMVLGIGSDPTTVNPLYANDRVSLTISHVLFDSPYNVKDGEIVYDGLAESMTASEDFLTYTLKIKENAKWHDGNPVVADDFIFTYNSIMDDKQNAPGQSTFKTDSGIIEYKKIDDKTIEFNLPAVDMTFVQSIAEITPIAKHVYENEADLAKSSKNENPIGNGPFKFKEHKTGELYQVERFDDYHGDVAKLDGIAYKVIPDENASLVALENGEISVSYIDAKDVSKYESNGNFNIVSFPEGMVDNVFFKVSSDNMSDVKVRKAISYAIDKNKLIQGTYLSEEYANLLTHHSHLQQHSLVMMLKNMNITLKKLRAY
ncbi:MAG: ABC transporter substrate-binding protein [Finegoldia sp.]|nr:ABC transporter substrate-binding protein [Finegoldia sp.]